MKHVLAVRHIDFEDLGTLEPLLAARGHVVDYVDPALGELRGVDPGQADLMVFLGGPVGAFNEDIYPFLADELRLLEQRLANGRPLLGICLGAQLMARVLGAKVEPMAGGREIGFAPLQLTTAGQRSALAPLAGVPVLHWHANHFGIPANVSCLAGTAHCAEQAFAYGPAALGLQFHLEADATRLERWLVGHACELELAGVDPRRLRQDARQHGARLATAANQVATRWLDDLAVQGLV